MAEHKPRPFFHMLPEDRAIWRRFLQHFEDQFETYTYDHLVGPRYDWGEFQLPPGVEKLAERLYALRIDVLAEREGEHWVIEVKPLAGLSALGQVLAYDHYLRKQLGQGTFIGRAIVTDYVRHYMPQLWEKYGIWVAVIPEDGEPEIIAPGEVGHAAPFLRLPEETEG